MSSERRQIALRIAALVFVVVLTIIIFALRNRLPNFEAYGYPGIFLISIVANATVILPLPGVFLTSAFGAVFNPFWVAVAAGSGATLGELSGYLAGFSGQRILERSDLHEKLQNWMRKYGEITLLVLAFLPNPAFDMAGITAGALKVPVSRFLFWTCLGKILKMLVFAYGGGGLFKLFSPEP